MPEEEGLNTTLGFAYRKLGQDDPESGGGGLLLCSLSR
jgi:hypothetical protein